MTMPNPQPGQMEQRMEDAIYAFIDPPKWSSNAESPEDNADWRQGYEAAQSNLRETLKPWWPVGGPLTLTRPTPDGEIGELEISADANDFPSFEVGFLGARLDHTCDHPSDIVNARLDEIERRIIELEAATRTDVR